MNKKIVTFGEIMLRLSKPDHQRLFQVTTFEAAYGGSEANVAVSLAVLGNSVRYISRVPDNPIGMASLMHLRQFGVDVDHVVRGGERLGTYYFEPSAGLRSSRVVYDRANSSFYTLRHGMIDWAKSLDGMDVFHCSGITCAVSQDALATTMDGVRMASAMGMEIACDINYRKNLWNYGTDAHAVLHELMQYSDFVFGDQDEWEVASGVPQVPYGAVDANYGLDKEAYSRYFDAMHEHFPRCKRMLMALRNQLSSTHHVFTGILWAEGKLFTTRIYDIQPVIDPMGAGDAFVAAFMHAQGRWPGDEQRCLDFGMAAAAMKNTIVGDQNLASEDEILSLTISEGGRIDR